MINTWERGNHPNMHKNILTNSTNIKNKKICFVAHEFGLFKGHGGIASYLYNICSWLLHNTTCHIFIISNYYDKKCDLFNQPNFNFYKIQGSVDEERLKVYSIITKIKPDYVEFADFDALGFTCIKQKVENNEFKNTIFVTNNHTASRECWEWSNDEHMSKIPNTIKHRYKQESYQIMHSDFCIAPSSFLAEYVYEHYNLSNKIQVFANPYFQTLKTKREIRIELSKYMNLSDYDNSFNILLISRFEGRKHQEELIKAVNNLRKKGLNIKLFLAGNTSGFNKTIKDYRYKIYNDLSEEEKNGIYIFDFLSLKEQEKLIAIADLTVMPSIYENQPVAMIETVLRGIPVMASKTSGIKDYTIDNELLFDAFEPNCLEKNIEHFYNMGKQKQQTLAKKQYDKLIEFINPQNSIINRFNTILGNGTEVIKCKN